MNTPAAIDVQIVDIKNDPQHKGFVRITAHVPVERGTELTAALGWPTYTNPVPAALAVLDLNTGDPKPPVREAGPREDKPLAGPASRLTKTAGMLCNDARFQKFIEENGMLDVKPYEIYDEKHNIIGMKTPTRAEAAAVAVRWICEVKSRSEIMPGTYSGDKWDALYSKFLAWKTAPEAENA